MLSLAYMKTLKRVNVFGTVWVCSFTTSEQQKEKKNMIFVWKEGSYKHTYYPSSTYQNEVKKWRKKILWNETKVLFVYFIRLAPLSCRFDTVFLFFRACCSVCRFFFFRLHLATIKNEELFVVGGRKRSNLAREIPRTKHISHLNY